MYKLIEKQKETKIWWIYDSCTMLIKTADKIFQKGK